MITLRNHIEEISKLTDEEFSQVETFFTAKKVRKNQYLLHEGDEVKYEYLVVKGIYKVFYVNNDGKEHIVQFAKENWWMSDYIGYFKQKFFSIGGKFDVLDAQEQPVCTLKGKWSSWDFKFLKGEQELASVKSTDPVRQLIMAAVMCIDMVLKE